MAARCLPGLPPLLALLLACVSAEAQPAVTEAQPAVTEAQPAVTEAQPAVTEAAAAPVADPLADATVRARESFKLGSTLARQGQWRDALAAFARSAELRPHAVTTYNMGYVERALGRLTRSRKLLQRALAEGEAEGEGLPPELAALARGYLVEIERRLARVSVLLDGAGYALAVDGSPLENVAAPGTRPILVAGTLPTGAPERAPARAFELVIDPGAHVIVVSAEEQPDLVLTRTFEPGGTMVLELPGRPAPKASRPAPPPAKTVPRDAPGEEQGSTHPWMWTALGIGAAGVVTGSVFGILALETDRTLAETCDPRASCPKASQDDIDRLHAYGTAADIGFGVGVAGLATGAVLWFLDSGGRPEPAATVKVHAAASAAGMSLGGSF